MNSNNSKMNFNLFYFFHLILNNLYLQIRKSEFDK
jgi:hypothetical protein